MVDHTLTATTDFKTDLTASSENGTGGHLYILRLRVEDPLAWMLMPKVLTRMADFVRRLELDTPIDTMQKWVRWQWASGNETVALWVALKGGELVGHAFGTIEQAWGIPYVMIVHVDMDRDAPVDLVNRDAFTASLRAWAKSQGAVRIKMLTKRSPEAWKRRMGFEFDNYLLKMEIG